MIFKFDKKQLGFELLIGNRKKATHINLDLWVGIFAVGFLLGLYLK